MLPRCIAPLVASALLLACASGSTPEPNDGGASADAAPDAADGSGAADAPDLSAQDSEGSDAFPTDLPTDAPEDVSPIDAASTCDILYDQCSPRSATCSDDRRAIVVCDRCGMILREDDCGSDAICDGADGTPECRPCTGDECLPPVEACTPSTTYCLDYRTIQSCTAAGQPGITTQCPGGALCIGSSGAATCSRDGNGLAGTCTQNVGASGGCKGRYCVCGNEYRASVDPSVCSADSGALASGYCSTVDCTSNRCDYGTALCADFELSGAFGGEDFCVERGGCSAVGQACGRGGTMRCQELPSRSGPDEPLSWELGCWVTTQRRIGDSCSSAIDCVGGLCLRQVVDGENLSYCASRCGASGGCPSNAACVLRPGTSSEWVCLAKANSTDCPRMVSESFWIETAYPADYAGSTTAICYFND